MTRVVKALASVRDDLLPSVLSRCLKEALWFSWEQPRLPRPLVDGKYPRSYPWSSEARESLARNPKRQDRPGQLIIEHIIPKRELLTVLLEEAESLVPERTFALLSDANRAVVISKAEDRLITEAGFGHSSPDQADPWARYRAAGIDVEGFAALS
ncbi:hypothetical protein FB385_3151 [Paramicrobacterium agarici]|nr:hypothetical protein FB385_3151 [Microbacterium agarici]